MIATGHIAKDSSLKDLQLDHRAKIRQKWLEKFPSRMHDTLCALSNGQMVAEEAYEAIEELHKYSPREKQLPRYAILTDSHPDGHENFFIGWSGIGDVLVTRLPSSIMIGPDGNLLPSALQIFALARSKGINHLVHTKSSASELINLAYDYHSMPKVLRRRMLSPLLQSYVDNRKALYDNVRDHGSAYYERMGLILDGSRDENYVLAMAAQQLMDDIKAAKAARAPYMVPVLQDAARKRHYLWNHKTKQFVLIPPLDHEASLSGDAKTDALDHRLVRDFLRSLPAKRGNKTDQAIWQALGWMLINGAAEYRKAHEELTDLVRQLTGTMGQGLHNALKSLTAFFSGCADSRFKSKAVLGPAASKLLRHGLRKVGGFLADPDGTLSEENELFLALAMEQGAQVVHSHHSRCGAMDAIHTYCRDPQSAAAQALPQDFKDLGEERMGLHKLVMSRGRNEEEIKAYYKKLTRITPTNIDDCYGIQQLLLDKQAAEKKYPNLIYIYVDMANCRTYVFDPTKNIFRRVPKADKTPLTASRPWRLNSGRPQAAPGCGQAA